MREVAVQAIDATRLEPLIGEQRMAHYLAEAARARELLAGRSVISVNSTAAGGGVAELLQSLLAYARGAGIDARWLVLDGDPEFFAITKRIHNWIHGVPGDVVLLHDPQPAGLAPALRSLGATIVWRCHIGADHQNDWTKRAWTFPSCADGCTRTATRP